MSTAITTSTRHIVTESPIGPLTLVRDDGGLTGLYFRGHWTGPGYAGGLKRKRHLLELEGAIQSAAEPLW